MRKNLTAEEVEKVCVAANKAAKEFVKAAWQSNWNAAALDHIHSLQVNLSRDQNFQGGLKMVDESNKGDLANLLLKSSGAQKEVDEYFLVIIQKMNELVLDTLSQAVESILGLSRLFLEEEAEQALQEFYQLYFSGNAEENNSDSQKVNDEVDRLMSQLEAGSLAEDDLKEDEEEKARRLGISGIQKRLETIISLDESLREKLAPVLTSMQFEDLTRHRLSNLEKVWTFVVREMAEPKNSLESLHDSISHILTSLDEAKQYYDCFENLEIPEVLLKQKVEKESLLLF